LTKFFLQTSDPEAPSVLNGRATFIPFAWVGMASDSWNEALVARDLWKRLRDLGIDERPLCMFGVMGWAMQVRHNTAAGKSSEDLAAFTDYDQITRLWNGLTTDIGGPVTILRKFAAALMPGYPEWPQKDRVPTFVHCMHEGSYCVRYVCPDHPVHKEVVPKLRPKIDYYAEPGASRLYVKAVNAETRATRRVMDRLGWTDSVLSRENIHDTRPTDNHGTLCKTMYEPPREAEEVAWIMQSPHHVPHLCAVRSNFPPLLEAMKKRGTLRCNVFCGKSGKLDDANADGLESLAAQIRNVRGE
jgi:hypothetical protein